MQRSITADSKLAAARRFLLGHLVASA